MYAKMPVNRKLVDEIQFVCLGYINVPCKIEQFIEKSKMLALFLSPAAAACPSRLSIIFYFSHHSHHFVFS